jgi:small subunit ribosomal protein S2
LSEVTLKELLEAGVHFGHQKKKWNPKMKKYIFGERNGICIIDLEKTVEGLRNACSFLEESAANGKMILFVGTKKQAQETIVSEASRCGMLHVNRRWLGGTLTNFETFRNRIRQFKELIDIEKDAPSRLTKKEILVLKRKRERLEKNLAGIKDMAVLPGVLVIVDPHREKIAVAEATKIGIPIVGIIDTNADPDLIQYCIPANDDAIRAVKLIVSRLADAVDEGKKKAVKVLQAKKTEKTEEKSEKPAETVKETKKPVKTKVIADKSAKTNKEKEPPSKKEEKSIDKKEENKEK